MFDVSRPSHTESRFDGRGRRARLPVTAFVVMILIASNSWGAGLAYLSVGASGNVSASIAAAGAPVNRQAELESASSLAQDERPAQESTVMVGSPYGLHAIDRDTGMQRWYVPAGDTSDSTPAVDDTTVFVGNDAGILFAIDAASGQEQWHRDFGEDRQVWSPTVAEGTVYVAAEVMPHASLAAHTPQGKVWALDAATGDERWTFATTEEVTTTPAFANGMVFVSVRDNHIYAIDAESGHQLWALSTPMDVSDPVIADGRLYVQVRTEHADALVLALDPGTGEQLWARSAGRVWAEATPAFANGVLVLVQHGAHGFDPYTEHLLALDAATGEQRWSAELEGELNALPLVQNGVVYIAGDICTAWRMAGMSMKCDGARVIRFYALDAESGDVQWSLDLPGELVTDPMISGNVAIIQGTFGMLSAIDLELKTERWRVLLVDLVAPVRLRV